MEKIELVETNILGDSPNKIGLCYKKVSTENIVCAVLETKNLYCVVVGLGKTDAPNITIINENDDDDEGCTIIEFPEYKGWSIFSAYAEKSSIKINLIKEE